MSVATFYLSSPNSQQQAEAVEDMPVLLSYGILKRKADFSTHWINKGYQQSFSRILIDSGAFSVMNSGKTLDVGEYADWAEQWRPHADAIAGLDSIQGDWRQSLRNYEAQPYAFPTMHDTDPLELLDDLVPMARERGGWIGIGLEPPRGKKQHVVAEILERIPPDLHVHGWALWQYAGLRGFRTRETCSFDSTTWWRNAQYFRKHKAPWLTNAECTRITVKEFKRMERNLT